MVWAGSLGEVCAEASGAIETAAIAIVRRYEVIGIVHRQRAISLSPLPFFRQERTGLEGRCGAALALWARYRWVLNLGVEVEEGVEAHFELGLDLLAAAFEDVHGDARLVAILQGDWSVAHLCYLVGGQQSHSIDQR